MYTEEQMAAFFVGLGAGLLLCVVVYIREQVKRQPLKKKIKELKNHLQQKLEIDAEATNRRNRDVEQLKAENENLRISNQSLAQKPGRREIMNLHVYQRAIGIMSEVATGFAPMWQKALKEAEQEIEEAEAGKRPFIKKIIPLDFFSSGSESRKRLDTPEDEEGDNGK